MVAVGRRRQKGRMPASLSNAGGTASSSQGLD
jgi:hypothetical protein